VTSYGGHLNYTVRYVPAPGGQSSRNNAPDVELISVSLPKSSNITEDHKHYVDCICVSSCHFVSAYLRKDFCLSKIIQHIFEDITELNTRLS
jgi:hypothetical protein